MNRKNILETSIALTCGERNVAYGEPRDNMAEIAAAASAILGKALTGRDIAIINAVQKLCRAKTTPGRADHYVDGAAYLAIAGECADAE